MQMTEDRQAGLILYSVLIGIVLTFVSLVVHYEEPWYLPRLVANPIYVGSASAYGFPFSWIIFGAPGALYGPFDLIGFLFDIVFWSVITYAILRYIAPSLIKLAKKPKRLS